MKQRKAAEITFNFPIVGNIHFVPSQQIQLMSTSPFSIRNDSSLEELVESIRQFGVLTPIEIRKISNDNYEIISGARRKYASDIAGYESIPAIILDLDSDDAVIRMVDCNIQRENLLPSERAKAYKMRLDAISRKAGRPTKNNSPNNSANFRGDDRVGQMAGISGDTVRNYISLTKLIPPLMEQVDNRKIGLTTAYHLTALSPAEQLLLVDTIDSEQAIPSFSQAQRMHFLSKNGQLNEDSMLNIMLEQKKPVQSTLVIPTEKIRKYFPKSFTPMQMETAILQLLDAWQRSRKTLK